MESEIKEVLNITVLALLCIVFVIITVAIVGSYMDTPVDAKKYLEVPDMISPWYIETDPSLVLAIPLFNTFHEADVPLKPIVQYAVIDYNLVFTFDILINVPLCENMVCSEYPYSSIDIIYCDTMVLVPNGIGLKVIYVCTDGYVSDTVILPSGVHFVGELYSGIGGLYDESIGNGGVR